MTKSLNSAFMRETGLPYFKTLAFPCSVLFPQTFEACKEWSIYDPEFSYDVQNKIEGFKNCLQRFARDKGFPLSVEINWNQENILFNFDFFITITNPELILRCAPKDQGNILQKLKHMNKAGFALREKAQKAHPDGLLSLLFMPPQLQERQFILPSGFSGRCP